MIYNSKQFNNDCQEYLRPLGQTYTGITVAVITNVLVAGVKITVLGG